MSQHLNSPLEQARRATVIAHLAAANAYGEARTAFANYDANAHDLAARAHVLANLAFDAQQRFAALRADADAAIQEIGR